MHEQDVEIFSNRLEQETIGFGFQFNKSLLPKGSEPTKKTKKRKKKKKIEMGLSPVFSVQVVENEELIFSSMKTE